MEDLKLQILSALGLNKEEEVKFETQAKLTDGTIIVSSADSLEAGVDVSILTEDGTTMPLPAGKYETEDGVGFSVEEEGIIAEIYEEEETEETEEVVEEEEMTEEERQPKKIKETKEVEFDKEGLINEIGAVIKELLNEVKSDIARLSSELDEMKGNNDDLQDLASTLETEKAELESQVKDLSKEPAEKPIKVSKFNKTGKVKEKHYSQMSTKERYIYNLNK
ncbi:MAG: hypothetical protein Tp1124DCM108671_24 [Prokaryotic dsDNA virus sp.]|nr:MAG: hypothetical protein Tp1125DCM102451_44 [Prokaryotic dsDNA virus sp.]QDP65581.1 MAG: hypothetical protein Tp1124DCM108671_24 [Prokaryotic dsDNA virus sp.]|tara:strand:- start:4470 stop:5135 length:666 start_codon:yes stop_codon:yes gene_type:complete